MTLPKFLFLLFLFIVSDTIAAYIAGLTLWSWRHLNGVSAVMRAMALLMFAICIEGCLALVAHSFGFKTQPVYTVGYAWSFWIGRAARSAALWMFVVTILKRHPRQ